MVSVQLVLRMEWKLKGVLRDLKKSIRVRCLNCKTGQINNMCEKSQIHSSEWSVKSGESFSPSLKAWLGNRLCPVRKRLNWLIVIYINID